jgi:uncharacterized membrane protein YbhN (UPF0104 family)
VNKSTKIWLNNIVRATIAAVLLYCIYRQVMKQLGGIDPTAWRQTGPIGWFAACVALMFANTSLEGYKWYLLSRFVEPVSYRHAFSSYLAGVAFALVTPNRVGEYPGRILYLGHNHTFRYINVAVLGVVAQLWSVYIFGMLGLVFYNITFPSAEAKVALVLCGAANIIAAVAYWRFESWLPYLERVKWLRKFALYGRLLTRITFRRQLTVLAISLLRFTIFTAQYLFLLRWMNVNVPLAEGFCLAALFFWIMAVVPSVALTELGVRGVVCGYLFQNYSSNTIGMLAATAGIWMLNLIIPSIFGSVLIMRMRLLS